MISLGLCRPTSPGLHAFSISFAVGLHRYGVVDTHTHKVVINNNNNKQQTTNNKQQTTNNKQQTTNNKQQTTNNKQQTTNNKQQTTNNKQQTTTTLRSHFGSSHFGSSPCVTSFFLRCFLAETSCWRLFVMLTHREPRGGGSDDSDSGFGTSV